MSLILTFLVFAGLDYWVLMSKHQYAEHLVHRYLQRMSVEGYLTEADENALKDDFANAGFSRSDLIIEGQRQSEGEPRILRNPADVNASTVSLRVSARPVPEPLFIGNLIGGTVPGGSFRIVVGDQALSERVEP